MGLRGRMGLQESWLLEVFEMGAEEKGTLN
jgi:hypothetical protein